MSLSENQPSNPDSANACCDVWKKKCSKIQEARNALRQAVKVLELKINEVQAHNVNLKKACEEERMRAKIESDEKLKEYNTRLSLENEVCSLKSEIAAIQQKHGGDTWDGNESLEGLQACIADREKEIGRLKELLEAEKRRADSERKNAEKERKKAAEAWKLVEVEKNKTAEKGMQIAKVEAEKAKEYKTQLGRLEKEVNESKMKLASQISAFKEVNKKFEVEKRKILAEKRNAESEMAKAKKMLEIEKQKVTAEQRRADAEMVKVEEQKALAETNWRKCMEVKCFVDQMSQRAEEDKRTIEDLKQKITELSSLRKPIEMAAVSTDIGVKAESTDVKLLKSQLKLEKLRAKYAKQKFKLEASRQSTLQNELGRLKIDFTQLLQRLDVLDASFSPFSGKHDQTKSQKLYMQNSDVTRQECNLDLSQMHSQLENELLQTCCTKIDACNRLRKNMQHTPLLALSGGNYSESIPGIDSKLKTCIRGSNRTKLLSSAVNSSSESFSDGQLMGSQETTAFPVRASAKVENTRQSICNSSDKFVAEHHTKRKHMHDETDYIANLSPENPSDLHGLWYRKEDKSLEGGRETLHNLNSVQQKNGRVHKKRKKSLSEKVVMVPQTDRDVKKGTEETNAEVYEDANVCRQTSCPGSYNLETMHSCGERICDAANIFDSIITFDKVTDGSYMKLLELDNAADEQLYRRAMDCPLSPSLPEIEFRETFDVNTLEHPFLEEAPQEDILSQRTDLFPSPSLDVINFEINSSEQKNDASGVSYDLQNKPTQSSETEVVKLAHMHNQETSRASCPVEINSSEQKIDASGVSYDSQNKPTQSSETEVVNLAHMHNQETSRVSCPVEINSSEQKNDASGVSYDLQNKPTQSSETEVVKSAHMHNQETSRASCPVEINSSEQKNDASGVSYDLQNKPTQSSETEVVKLAHMHNQETSRASCPVEINSSEQKIDASGVSYDSQNKPTQSSETEVVNLAHMHNQETSRVSCPVEINSSEQKNDASGVSYDLQNKPTQSSETEVVKSAHMHNQETSRASCPVEINSSEQKNDVSGVTYDLQNKPTQSSETEVVKSAHMHTEETSRASCPVDDEFGPIHNQLPKFCVVFSDIEDNSIISRILFATKACIARCSLATQTVWEVGSILTALKMEGTLLPKEKVSVLLTLMLFNFVMTTTRTFGKLWDGNIFHCLSSYAEHIHTVMSDAETRILFSENYSLHELLGLIEDFLIEGKVIVNNTVPAETLSDCDLRSKDLLDSVNNFSSDVASSEQLLAGSIILASVCAATDQVGFICEASYDIFRLCKWDSLMVLTILHIFAYLGGEKFFDLDSFGSMVTVLKSLVILLEGECLSAAATSLPSIDQLHTEFCTNQNRKCPFSDGAESIDTIACLLLDEIKNCCLQGIEQVALSDSRLMSDHCNAKQWSNLEDVLAINKNCDVPCCFKKCMVSATQSDLLRNVSFCHLSDVLSLVELVANNMSWHWTDNKLVPELLNMLDSCVEEKFTIAIIVLLGQLGRIGIDASGYEDQGVENLRCNLFGYLDHTSSRKAGISLQISTAAALFGLLPVDLETLVHTDISLPAAYSKSVSDNAKTLRNWFSGLDKDEQRLLSSILRPQ